jgi:hypothetical protein
MGNKMDEKTKAIWRLSRPTGDLVAALGRMGLKREDITLVINTHLPKARASNSEAWS